MNLPESIIRRDFIKQLGVASAAALGTEVAGLLATTITQLCDGQIQELQTQFDPSRSVDAYERSITGKTASLLGTSCRIGALVGGLPRPVVESLTEFGLAYGMAFQVVDDLLDVVATDEQLGKPAGNDLVEGTYTLPTLNTASLGGEEVVNISCSAKTRLQTLFAPWYALLF